MIKMDREDLVIMMEAGYLYLRMGKLKEAQEVFEGVQILVPESDVPWVALGSLCFGQYRFDQAIKHYQKALTLQPGSAFAHAYLGEALVFKGDTETGMKSLEKASLLEPTGKSGDFARALMEGVKEGFIPPKVRDQGMPA